MPLRIGDVIRVWDRHTRPPKFKRHICICPERQMFLRINSEPIFPPKMPIPADGADFLEADSYVELWQLVRHYELEIQNADELGRLTRTHVQALRTSID